MKGKIPEKDRKIEKTEINLQNVIRYQAGEEHLLESIIHENEGLVRNIYYRHFSRFSYATLGDDDFLQEGRLGVMKAAQLFDPSLGYTFSTYATCWIKCYMKRLTRTASDMKIPDYVATCMDKINIYQNKRSAKGLRPATKEEIISHFKPKDNQQLKALENAFEQLSLKYASLDELIGEKKDTPRHETLDTGKEHFTESSEITFLAEQLKSCLSEREKIVIEHRFNGFSLEEIGRMMEISQQRVRQLETRAIKKMRAHARKINLYQDMGYKQSPVIYERA